MRFPGFIGPTYTLQSLNVDSQRCVNLYPEIDELGKGNEGEIASLVSTPGLRLLVTLPTAPVRGNFTDSLGQLWTVGGNVLYKISDKWNATAFGTLSTSIGPVSFEDNGFQAVVVDGPFGYYWSIVDLPTSTIVTAAGTTTLVASSNTKQVFTGSTTQTVLLPDVTTLLVGEDFYIENLSTDLVTVQSSDATVVQVMASGSLLIATCTATSGAGTTAWEWSYTTNHISGSTFSQITDTSFLGADRVAFLDGFLIFNSPGTDQYYLSPINAVTPFSALDKASAEASPDNLVGHVVLQENLYLFGTKSLEIWYDSGGANFPFARIQGAVSDIGCASAFSIEKIENAVYWVSQDKDGQGIVYRAQGLQPQRISNFGVENALAQISDLSGARAWSYQESGHAFYCLNIPGSSTTWVFDARTNMWHERARLSEGSFQRHQADSHSFAYKTHVVGDFSSGNIYALDPSVYSDNGNPIVRERASPHISKDLDRICHSSFQLDVEAGVGIDGSGQGIAPQVVLQWSDDFGHSWSNEKWASFGAIGKRRTRATWRRLGQARDRVYRVRISDPVKVTLLGAEIEIEEEAA